MRNKLCRALGVICLAVNARAAGCIAVSGDHVLAKDLAGTNSWFAQMDPNTDAGMTPLPGVARVIRGRELRALAGSAKGVAIPDSFADICVELATEPLTRAKLQPVLDAALGGPAVVLEFSHFRIPAGTLEFTPAGLAPSGLWRGRLLYGAHRSTPVWATIQMGSSAPKTRARDVEHGDRVAVEVTSGGARLAFDAIAESPGRTGESILVRNPDNGHLFQAKVLEEGKVFIHK